MSRKVIVTTTKRKPVVETVTITLCADQATTLRKYFGITCKNACRNLINNSSSSVKPDVDDVDEMLNSVYIALDDAGV